MLAAPIMPHRRPPVTLEQKTDRLRPPRHMKTLLIDRHIFQFLNIFSLLLWRQASGSRGRLPAPSSHTTVRTVRYTAVHE